MKEAKTLGFEIQERDELLLRDLFESRLMTSIHVADLHFEGRREAAKKRLQTLKGAGLIGERTRRAADPAILYLTKAGHAFLAERGVLKEYPRFTQLALEKRASVGDLTLRHELEVMDVKAAFHVALRGNSKFLVTQFATWPRLLQFEAAGLNGRTSLVKPDGFISIHEKEDDGGLSAHSFFFELDRSTETLESLLHRANCYLDYYRSGGFAERNGGDRTEFKDYPFRVLIVFKTAERRNLFAESLLLNEPPILTLTYLTTIDEVRREPHGRIWVRPMDYRTAVSGTEFEPVPRRTGEGYKRSAEKEAAVEHRLARVGLFES